MRKKRIDIACDDSRRRSPVSVFVHGLIIVGCATGFAGAAAARTPDRVKNLNQAFLKHLESFSGEHALAVETIRRGWRETYQEKAPDGFVPDALALLYPPYRAAMEAFDVGDAEQAIRLLKPLREHADPFLAANAAYFQARAMVDRQLLEEAQSFLSGATEADSRIERFTPYAPHLWFIKSFCEVSNLDFEQGRASLQYLERHFPEAPEPIEIGARQLALELERRQKGTLDEISDYMSYSATRLKITDASEKVQSRQEDVIAMLDKLIEEAEQREQQQRQQGGGGRRQSGSPQGSPRNPRDQSTAPPGGAARDGDQHEAPKANPGEMWGKLRPAEREEILKSLRARFPSRYRQLVEQYYRSLADQK